jgi:lysyl-tRNA synthetase class 2
VAELLRGRVAAVDGPTVHVHNEHGVASAVVRGAPPAPGDVVEIDAASGACRVLTPFRGDPAAGATLARRILDPRRRRALAVRARVEDGIRAFFRARDFHDVRTPVAVPSPGMEPHIRPFRVDDATGAPRAWLHTSPEFAMKRLLVGGLERVFQLAPVFRDEPRSATHLREFLMLEWYRAFADETAIMADVEALVAALATAEHGAPRLGFAGATIDVTPPWPRLSVRELFRAHAGVDPVPGADLAAACARHGLAAADDDTWDDRYFRLWLAVVEPRLPADRAVFVTRYPASQAALAVVDTDPDGTPWARRFEVYAGGLELGNAFCELTDPVAQRRRFEDDMALRARTYGDAFPPSPIDEEFLAALGEGLPPSGGIAMGVDRLVMLLADEPDVSYTVWLPPP